MSNGRFRFGATGWLLAIIAVAFAARVSLTYYAVFGHDTIRFVENDAWYHMRLVDATVRHFPARLWFDPYAVHPTGEPIDAGPFFDWIVAGTALALGMGSPSPNLVDSVGAYVPPVLGALLCLPVYVLGREFFSRRAGLWAAFVIAVVPAQTLIRSELGYTDHHCAETLLSTTALMWIVLALDRSRAWRLRLLFSAAAGVTLGCYLLTWSGGSLFVLVIASAGVANLVLQRLRGSPTADDLLLLSPALIIAIGMVMPWIGTRPYFRYHVAMLTLGVVSLLAVHAWGIVSARFSRDRLAFGVGMVAAVLMGLALAFIVRGNVSGLGEQVRRLLPWGRVAYVREAVPLLQSELRYPIPLWNEFGPSLLLAIAGSFFCLAGSRIEPRRGLLLFIWTCVLLAATVAQVRFTYYLGVNIALLAGYAADALLRAVEFRRRQWRVVTAVVALAVIASPLAARMKAERHKPSNFSDDWYDALQWLNARTPEPFGDPDAYYRTDYSLDENPRTSTSTYGVLAWWDYGYFIVRVGRRVPVTNPRQTRVTHVAKYLLAQDAAKAKSLADDVGARYVVVDAMLQSRIQVGSFRTDGFFGAVATAAGRKPTDFCEEFDTSDEGTPELGPRLYCYPNYYRAMAVRLYAFGGRAVLPSSVTAIFWADGSSGRSKRLVGQRTFATFEEASRFVASQPSTRWRIASSDPLTSCVPLEALPEYRQVFRSIGEQPTSTGQPGPSFVQIYERGPGASSQRQTQ
jgi:oligosaccharyl transferase (archaeosortase A-associated)